MVDVDERETRPVIVRTLPRRHDFLCHEAEFDFLRLGLKVATVSLDGKWGKDFDALIISDVFEVGAGVFDDEVLVQSGEGKVSSTSGQEWEGAGDLLVLFVELAVKSILLAFLADN